MQTIAVWKKRSGGMEVSGAKRGKALRAENQELKRWAAARAIPVDDLKGIRTKSG